MQRKSCSFIRATLFFLIYNKSIKEKGEKFMAYNLVTDKLYRVDFEELEIMFKKIIHWIFSIKMNGLIVG